MHIRRRFPVIAAVLLVIAAVLLAVLIRKQAPPEPARLLPSADGFVYVNFSWIRRISLTGQLPAVPHDSDYEQFIQATGFQFERDLEQAAFAVHYPVATGPRENRFSEVLVGKVDGERLRAYLQKISQSVESYDGRDIYNIPLEGRTLRVCLLGVDTVAASNHPDPHVIRGIIDRSRKLASPFGGPSLLRQYYKHVPLASLTWGIFQADPSSTATIETLASPVNWAFLFSRPAVVVTSARYLGNVHFRAEAFTASDSEAAHVSSQLSAFLDVFQSAEASVGAEAPDPDLKAFFSSIKVQQNDDRAELTAILPLGLLRKVVSEAPVAASPDAQSSPQVAKPATAHKAKPHK